MWWCWIGYAWLANVVKADEGVMRVGMFVAMGAMFVGAITIPEAFDDLPGGLHGPMVFAFCYFAVRAVHLALFWVASAATTAAARPGAAVPAVDAGRHRAAAGRLADQRDHPDPAVAGRAARRLPGHDARRLEAGGWARPRTSPSGTG